MVEKKLNKAGVGKRKAGKAIDGIHTLPASLFVFMDFFYCELSFLRWRGNRTLWMLFFFI